MKVYTNMESNVKNITKFITNVFDINKSGFSVISIDKIPRNHSGKILYSELDKK